MSVASLEYICANGHGFEAAGSGDYGEFVMRGEISPTPGVLVALDNPWYDEVDTLVRSLGGYEGMGDGRRADLLQSIFGLACDPGPDGTTLRIGRRRACPVCGTREMASWEVIGAYSGPSFPVTHEDWKQLTATEKRSRVEAALRQESGRRPG